jgi:lipopolysaccharide heptosyltransferase II
MSVPAVRAFKRGRPDAHVTLLTKTKLADFWRMIPEVDDIIELPPKFGVRAAARAIRSRDLFDAAILMPNSLRSALEVWLAGVPVRVGYRGHFRSKLLTKIMPRWPRLQPPRSQVDVFLQLAKKCGADTRDPTLRDSLAVHLHGAQSAVAPFGAICPGAEYGPAKRWHPERFAAVAKHLSESSGLRWIVVGTAKERALCDTVANEIGGEPIAVNLAGRTSLTELAQQLRLCALLLTNDTGTMHLAGLLGTPTVAVFGSTEPALTTPLGARHRVVRRHVECSPCFLRKCPLDFRCMNEVTVETVLAAAKDLLNEHMAL